MLEISYGPDIRIRIRIYFYIRIRIRKRLLIHIRIRIGKTCGCRYLIEKCEIYRIFP